MQSTIRDQPQFPGEGVSQSPGPVRQAKRATAESSSPINLHSVREVESMERVKEKVKVKERLSVVKTRKLMKIGTLNVRTISKDGRREELAYNFEKYGLNILGVQEHRREHQEDIAYNKLGASSMFITASCTRNTKKARVCALWCWTAS